MAPTRSKEHTPEAFFAHTKTLLDPLREHVNNIGAPADIVDSDYGAQCLCTICGETKPETEFYKDHTPEKRGNIKVPCINCKRNQFTKADFPEVQISSRQIHNTVTCAVQNCNADMQRFGLPYHQVLCHPFKPLECKHCDFRDDCAGAMIRHLQTHHNITISLNVGQLKIPVFTCSGHVAKFGNITKNAYYNRTEVKEKNNRQKRKQHEESKHDPRYFNAKRIAGQALEESGEREGHAQQDPEKRRKYEEDPIRVAQIQMRERMKHTISKRLNWKYANTDVLRSYYQVHHAKHRETRNAYARQYRLGNTNLKWAQLQNSTRVNGHTLTIDKEQAVALYQQPCFYCDIPAVNASKSQLNGIDRINSDLGYVVGNVVPCCPTCNIMKGATDVKLFLAQVSAIAQHFSTGQQTVPAGGVLRDNTMLMMERNMINLNLLRDNVEYVQGFFDTTLAKSLAEKNKSMFGVLADALPSNITECELGRMASNLECDIDGVPSDVMACIDKLNKQLVDIPDIVATQLKAKRSVIHRGKYQWNLTAEESLSLVMNANCAYCNYPSKTSLTLDRLDSTKNYDIGNVVPCCFRCNMMKHVLLPEVFLDKVRVIASRFPGKDVSVTVYQRLCEMELSSEGVVCAPIREHKPKEKKSAGLPKRAKITDTVLLTNIGSSIQTLFHTREHKMFKNAVMIPLSVARAKFPAIQACTGCVSTDSTQLVPFFSTALVTKLINPAVVHTQEELDRLCDLKSVELSKKRKESNRKSAAKSRGGAHIVKSKPGEYVLHSMFANGKYHTGAHPRQGGNAESLFAVKLEHLKQALPKVQACNQCVCENSKTGPQNFGQDCPVLSTLELVTAQIETAAAQRRAKDAATKRAMRHVV